MTLKWDYTNLAAKYDDRADYAPDLIAKVFTSHNYLSTPTILDMGAGTGKLTKELIKMNCFVIASEPNDEMRKFGTANIIASNCKWINSPGENIQVEDNSIDSIWFGSSFNVIDQNILKNQLKRILKPEAWLTCLWNHRNLNNPLQAEIENLIKTEIPNYDYGKRRQDPSAEIKNLGNFGEIVKHEINFEIVADRNSYIDAWKSHATLQRQCKDQEHFLNLISNIERIVGDQPTLQVPYTTRLWTSQLIS